MKILTLTLAALLLPATLHARSLELGNASGAPGGLAWVPVIIHGADLVGMQLDLIVPLDHQIADDTGRPLCVTNPAIHRDWPQFSYGPGVCTPGVDCEYLRAITLDLSEHRNDLLPDGAVVMRCAVRVPQEGAVAIGCQKALAAGIEVVTEYGTAVAVDCVPGSVRAVGCAAGDMDGSGTVTIDEVVGTVQAALNGCPVH